MLTFVNHWTCMNICCWTYKGKTY